MLFTDGSIALARVNPYRVDWILPGGRAVAGPPLAIKSTAGDATEKRAAIDRALLSPLVPDEFRRPEAYDGWPQFVPPFGRGALLAAPNGRLVIRRMPVAASRTSDYDVVNSLGARERSITLRPNERIVGFGAYTVYVVVTDDDDIERLRRHPWP